MATIDTLTLKLDAEGANNFIRAMDTAGDSLRSVRDEMERLARENGTLDRDLDRSERRKKKKEDKDNKKKNKATEQFNKNVSNGVKSLDKMLKTLMAISGISFGLKTLSDKSDLAARTGTDYANQSRNINASPRDLEAVNTALDMGGFEKGTLNDLINKLSDNQSRFLSGRGGNEEIQQLIARLNGWDRSGNRIDATNTDPIETLKSIAKMLQANTEYNRKSLISLAGLDSNSASFLSNNRVNDLLRNGYALSIQNESRTARSQSNNAAIVGADKQLENAWMDAGEAFTPVRIALTNLGTRILNEVNKMAPKIEEAMPALSKLADTILEWVQKILGKLTDLGLAPSEKNNGGTGNDRLDEYLSENPKSEKLTQGLIELDRKIEFINTDDGIAYMTDGNNYKMGDWFNLRSGYESDYLDYVIKNNKAQQLSDYTIPQTGQQLMNSNYSTQNNNSSNQTININELNVTSNASNIAGIVADAGKNSQFISGNVGTLYPHMGNTK